MIERQEAWPSILKIRVAKLLWVRYMRKKAINLTKNHILADNLESADTVLARMIGLLGKKFIPEGYGLLINPCKGIHTFGMNFDIDVLFLGKNNLVVAVKKRISPNRITKIYFKAVCVLELPAGTIEMTATKIGDYVEIG